MYYFTIMYVFIFIMSDVTFESIKNIYIFNLVGGLYGQFPILTKKKYALTLLNIDTFITVTYPIKTFTHI